MTEVAYGHGWKPVVAGAAGLVACSFLVTLGARVIAGAGNSGGGIVIMAMWMVAAGFGVLSRGLLPILDRYPPASPEGARRHRRVSRTAPGFAALTQLYFLSALPVPPRPNGQRRSRSRRSSYRRSPRPSSWRGRRAWRCRC